MKVLLHSFIALLLFSMIGNAQTASSTSQVISSDTARPIICDSFSIETRLVNDTLYTHLLTDLPEFTRISISIGRNIYAKSDSSFSIDLVEYYVELSRVSTLQSLQKYAIIDSNWLDSFDERVARHSRRADKYFVSDSIYVRMYVPVNRQYHEAFGGHGSPNLQGSKMNNIIMETVKI